MLMSSFELRTTLSKFRAQFEKSWNHIDNIFHDYGYSLSYVITPVQEGNGLIIDFGIYLQEPDGLILCTMSAYHRQTDRIIVEIEPSSDDTTLIQVLDEWLQDWLEVQQTSHVGVRVVSFSKLTRPIRPVQRAKPGRKLGSDLTIEEMQDIVTRIESLMRRDDYTIEKAAGVVLQNPNWKSAAALYRRYRSKLAGI